MNEMITLGLHISTLLVQLWDVEVWNKLLKVNHSKKELSVKQSVVDGDVKQENIETTLSYTGFS